MARGALHRRELAARVVLDVLQFLPIVRPCHHVEVGTYGGKAEAMRLVEILVDPLLVYLVGTRIARERLHIAGAFLETLQILLAVVDQQILVINMVARQQQADGRGERQTAVRWSVESFVTGIGSHIARQVFRVGERVQAQDIVADAHLPGREGDVLQAGGILQ